MKDLRDKEEWYRRIVETSLEGIWAMDARHRTTFTNHRMNEMLGYSEEELLGRPVTDFMFPEDMADHAAQMRNRHSGKPAIYERRFRRKDGSECWAILSATALLDENGNFAGSFGMFTDITPRKQAESVASERLSALLEARHAAAQSKERVERAEKALHRDDKEREQAESQLRLQALVLDQISDHVTITDLNGVISYVNDAELRSLGYSRAELIGASVERYGEDPERGATQREILEKTKENGYWRGEVVNRAADGREIILDCRTHLVRDGQGNPVALCGISTDVTERKRVDAERERLALAADQVTEALLITGTDGTIEYVNPAFEKITGYTREEALGRTPRILKSGLHDQAFYEDLWGTLKRGAPWSGRFINKKKDGTLYTEDAVISPLRDLSGKTVNYVAVKRDITREARLEEQLHHAQKMESVGRLAGGVAHDFNNMLSVILGHLDLVLGRVEPGDPLYDDLCEIRTAAERSAGLTKQLLAFARRQPIAPRVLDLNEVVEGLLKMLRRMIGEDIDLIWLPGAGLWRVKIDPSQVGQILANLCVNTRDAILGVGKVTIETENVASCDSNGQPPGEYVRLSVRDDGCGMDEETLAHVFEPYFTTKEAGKGSGLGLATVYGIVRQNGGFISVASIKGQGTVFSVYLPRRTEQTDQGDGKDTAPTVPRGRETILLVEDEPAILGVTARALERLGYHVLPASGAGKAIALLKEHRGPVDLLLTDIVMPEMDGRELARRVLSIKPDVKCLFMSGYTTDVIRTASTVESHASLDERVNFIQKPFAVRDLAFKLRGVLDAS